MKTKSANNKVEGDPSDTIQIYMMKHAGITLAENKPDAIIESIRYLFEEDDQPDGSEYVISTGFMTIGEYNDLEEFAGF